MPPAKKKAKRSTGKFVTVVDGKALVLSPFTKKIITALEDGCEYYSDLQRRTKISTSSLYVYVNRLKDKKMVTVVKDPARAEIRVQLIRKIKLLDAVRV